jgi:hypothetical protein
MLIPGNKLEVDGDIRPCGRDGINLSNPPPSPYMLLQSCYEGSPSGPHGAIVGG